MAALRQHFSFELDQLRLQVEVMGVRVGENLRRMKLVIASGDPDAAAAMIAADDEIDAMNVSLTERCHELLRREAPVASDLRFVVSVLRILSELERVGDLALRVAKAAPDHHLLLADPALLDTLGGTAEATTARYDLALEAWATLDLDIATELAMTRLDMDSFHAGLMAQVMALHGPDATRAAICAFSIGKSLERIGDHATIIGARLRYLITGDPSHLAAEVR